MEDCVYLGEPVEGRTANRDNQVFRCSLHEYCTTKGKWKRDGNDIALCGKCKDRLPIEHEYFSSKFQDPLQLYNAYRKPFQGFRNLLAGGTAFLLCGGPSAKSLAVEQLNQRGCWTLAVNNVAGWDRVIPQAFTCSDPPSKFCDGIWRDPKIMKFVPEPKLRPRRGRLRTKLEDSSFLRYRFSTLEKTKDRFEEGPFIESQPGESVSSLESRIKIQYQDQIKSETFRLNEVQWLSSRDNNWHPLFDFLSKEDSAPLTSQDCPNTWGYSRRSWMKPDSSFFTETSAAWGNHNEGVEKYGEKKTVCTMLLGMRLLYYLGARRIYLVGVDFHMDPAKRESENYSFGEGRTSEACSSNNSQYVIVNEWLCKMEREGVFKKFGVEFFNTNPTSGLRAFPYVPFDTAIIDARKGLPREPYDLRDWYIK